MKFTVCIISVLIYEFGFSQIYDSNTHILNRELNDSLNCIKIVVEKWEKSSDLKDSAKWIISYKENYYYNDSGQIHTQETYYKYRYYYGTTTDTGRIESKTITQYNKYGDIIFEMKNYYSDSSLSKWHWKYEYDEYNRKKTAKLLSWESSDSSNNQFSIANYKYNRKGNVLFVKINTGYPKIKKEQKHDNLNAHGWNYNLPKYNRKIKYKYNNKNQLVECVRKSKYDFNKLMYNRNNAGEIEKETEIHKINRRKKISFKRISYNKYDDTNKCLIQYITLTENFNGKTIKYSTLEFNECDIKGRDSISTIYYNTPYTENKDTLRNPDTIIYYEYDEKNRIKSVKRINNEKKHDSITKYEYFYKKD
ncbi:MAG: hypothetical protein ACOZCO_11225 [Bacteroidota bacterium]